MRLRVVLGRTRQKILAAIIEASIKGLKTEVRCLSKDEPLHLLPEKSPGVRRLPAAASAATRRRTSARRCHQLKSRGPYLALLRRHCFVLWRSLVEVFSFLLALSLGKDRPVQSVFASECQ
eukprot:TRINITY_DN19572_c0_g1_i1.p2 TRINITY_DN19572_c0_g1~~TRINITY_DN19572_c0_g1_i1.p2  ORF type:complete len:121 (+),score=2.50 TRINITY_DN19572_c0_g1_i1:712-1074(+)